MSLHHPHSYIIILTCVTGKNLSSSISSHIFRGIHKYLWALDFKCNECGKSFLTESDLKGHKQLHHRQQQERTRLVYGMIVISNS